MFAKLGAFFKVLRVGNEVADPDKWMKRQADGNKVGLLILALLGLAKVYGYDFPIEESDALILGGAVVSIWNIVFGAVTSYKQGLLPAPKHAADQPAAGGAPADVQQGAPATNEPVVQADGKAAQGGGDFDKNIYIG